MSVIVGCAVVLIVSHMCFIPVLGVETSFDVKGLIVVVFTPVDKNLNINVSVIPQYAQFLRDNGIDGVVVAGTTGEGPTLSTTDGKKLLEAWVTAAKPLQLSVISSIGGQSLPNTIEMAKYSEEVGVDAIVAVPDGFYRPNSADELVFYMTYLANAAPNTPLLYDNNPSFGANVNIVDFFKKASNAIPNFKGIVSRDFEAVLQLQTLARDDQRIFPANYAFLAPAFFMGFDSFVMPELSLFPELGVNIAKNAQQGYFKRARAQNRRLIELRSLITENGNAVAALKAAMPLITGIDMGSVRPPIFPLTNEQIRNLKDRLSKKGVIDFSSKCTEQS